MGAKIHTPAWRWHGYSGRWLNPDMPLMLGNTVRVTTAYTVVTTNLPGQQGRRQNNDGQGRLHTREISELQHDVILEA